MGPTLATGLVTGFYATTGILGLPSLTFHLHSQWFPSLWNLGLLRDLRISRRTLRRLGLLSNVIEVCQKFDGPYCNFPHGLEVAALVSAEAFVIFSHSVGRHISEDSNYQRFYWHTILKLHASCSERVNYISVIVNGMDKAHS